jgi:hypothetical protein
MFKLFRKRLSKDKKQAGKGMAASVEKEPSGLFVIRLSGTFTVADRNALEKFGRENIDRGARIKVLILDEDFSGWSRQGDWGDLTFMLEYDRFIEKIAVVASEKWRDRMMLFLGAGLREASVEFFPLGEERIARGWLV